jgi:DNA-binding MarR family transcriptional regulator
MSGDNMKNISQENNAIAHSKHPAVNSISDLLSFKIARLSGINQRLGGYWLKKKFDLGLNDWRILGLTTANQPVPFKKIQEMLDMDKGQFSRSVKMLVDRGYISVGPSKIDGRALDLTVTKIGKQLSDDMLRFLKHRNDVSVDCLTKSECDSFLKILQKITDHSIDFLESYE